MLKINIHLLEKEAKLSYYDEDNNLIKSVTYKITKGVSVTKTTVGNIEYVGYYKHQGAPIYPNAPQLTSVQALMETIHGLHTGINLALFAAHGTLRLAAMGLNPDAPGKKELDAMSGLLREAAEAGALGLSTGLMYAPGSFSDTEELKALCRAVKGTGAVYTSHIRNQGNLLRESVREAIDAAAARGVDVTAPVGLLGVRLAPA